MNQRISFSETVARANKIRIEKQTGGISALICRLFREERDKIVDKPRNSHNGDLVRWGSYSRTVQVNDFGYLNIEIPRIKDKETGRTYSISDRWNRFSDDMRDKILGLFGDGMSARKASRYLKERMELRVSTQGVCNVVRDFVRDMDDWRERELDSEDYEALVLDGVYVSKRGEKKLSGIIAAGVKENEEVELLDFLAVDSESEKNYKRLLNRLYERGIEEIDLIVGDGLRGIWNAVDFVYPEAKKQRCLRHKEGEIKRELQKNHRAGRLHKCFWWIYEADTKREALQRAKLMYDIWKRFEPEAAEKLIKNITQTVVYYELPKQLWTKVRTTNMVECFFKNLKDHINRYPGFNRKEDFDDAINLYLYENKKDRLNSEELPLIAS